MFEILHSAMLRDQLRIHDDGFFTITDRGEFITSTTFFAMTDKSVAEMVAALQKIANGRPIIVSLAADATETSALREAGFVEHMRKGNTVRWRLGDAASSS